MKNADDVRNSNRIPDICIKGDVYRKIQAYTDLCHNEISALGSVEVVNGKLYITDIFLFDQVVTGASTDISPESISKFICDYIKSGKDPSILKFWWHSHVNMEVFWSGTDIGTIERFSSDYMISMVSNKRGEFKVRLDLYDPLRMYMDDLPLNIEYDKTFNDLIKQEIDAKVKREIFPSYHGMFTQERPLKYPLDQGISDKLPMRDAMPRPVVEALPVTSPDVNHQPDMHDEFPKPIQEPTPFQKQMDTALDRQTIPQKETEYRVPVDPLPRYQRKKTVIDRVCDMLLGHRG